MRTLDDVRPATSVVHTHAGEEDAVWTPGMGFGTILKVRTADTGGSVSVVEHVVKPGVAIPFHRHQYEEETSVVLEGRLTAQIGETKVLLAPGEFVVKPRGIWHAFWNDGPEVIRFYEIISPGGFEKYFFEREQALGDPSRVRELNERFGIEFR